MKFGKHLKIHAKPEWIEYYVDYDFLKYYIKIRARAMRVQSQGSSQNDSRDGSTKSEPQVYTPNDIFRVKLLTDGPKLKLVKDIISHTKPSKGVDDEFKDAVSSKSELPQSAKIDANPEKVNEFPAETSKAQEKIYPTDNGINSEANQTNADEEYVNVGSVHATAAGSPDSEQVEDPRLQLTFQELILVELNTAVDFTISQKMHLVEDMTVLKREELKVQSWTVSGYPDLEENLKILKEKLLNLGDEVIDTLDFMELNTVAIKKCLKKWDKVIGQHIGLSLLAKFEETHLNSLLDITEVKEVITEIKNGLKFVEGLEGNWKKSKTWSVSGSVATSRRTGKLRMSRAISFGSRP